jgi:hypothetical protein
MVAKSVAVPLVRKVVWMACHTATLSTMHPHRRAPHEFTVTITLKQERLLPTAWRPVVPKPCFPSAVDLHRG